ncbi:MAG TPA: SH3 domain-containing protein [Pyrinomonadaceae bacterium]|jgi:hypothetical protein
MKRCPQCNSVFDDSLVYCTNDGTHLVEEIFVLPSEVSPLDTEEETVIHHEPPITIDIPDPNRPAPTKQFNYPNPPVETVIPVVVEKRRNTGKYLLFLFLGLILGGGLVAAGVLFAIYLSQNKPTEAPNTATRNSQINSAPTPKPTLTPTPVIADPKHERPTAAPDDDFNGRVISLNAYVRSSPNRNAKQIDVLPIDDRLEIEEREDENSPWFRVTCEHGTTGWMHGNTIEYTR